MRRLSNFARVVTFDKRGKGLSDRISGVLSLEQRIDDVRAIMDEIGSRRAALLGISEGCAMSILFAATHPERVLHLVLYCGFARGADRWPTEVTTQGALEGHFAQTMKSWGNGDSMKIIAPSLATDKNSIAQLAKFERLASSPGALKTLLLLHGQIDVTAILPAVQVPTLVLHRRTDAQVPVALGAKLAAQIPGVKYIEHPSGDHAFWTSDPLPLIGDIEEFVTAGATPAQSTWSAFSPPFCSWTS